MPDTVKRLAGQYCCEKAVGTGKQVCPECVEISAGFQACMGVSPEPEALRALTPEQEAALRRFISKNKRNWKYKLHNVWLNDNPAIPDAAILRQLRNQQGPDWLRTFKGFKK